MSEDGIFVCVSPFRVKGHVIRRGTTVRVGHPLLKGREMLFRPFKVDYEFEPPRSSRHSRPEEPKPAPKSEDPKPAPKPKPAPRPESVPEVLFEDPE